MLNWTKRINFWSAREPLSSMWGRGLEFSPETTYEAAAERATNAAGRQRRGGRGEWRLRGLSKRLDWPVVVVSQSASNIETSILHWPPSWDILRQEWDADREREGWSSVERTGHPEDPDWITSASRGGNGLIRNGVTTPECCLNNAIIIA